jgi:hypothetical protein
VLRASVRSRVVVRTCPPRPDWRCRRVASRAVPAPVCGGNKGRPTRPVLKHGPRSLTCARVIGSLYTQRRIERKGRPSRRLREDGGSLAGPPHSRGVSSYRRSSVEGEAHPERTRWYPKDGELCLARTKPGETLVEVRSDSDVQIDRQSWV